MVQLAARRGSTNVRSVRPRWVRPRKRAVARVERNPFELWLVAACAVSGAASLLTSTSSRVDLVSRYLPTWAPVWYAGLLVAGLLTTAGLVWPRGTLRRLGLALTLERAGLALLAGWLAGFGGALEAVTPRAPVGVLLLGLAGASVVRVRRVGHELR